MYLKDKVSQTEYDLAKWKFIENLFPGTKISQSTYQVHSKLANENFNNHSFILRYRTLYIVPSYITDFEYAGKKEQLKIYAVPKFNRLAYVGWNRATRKEIIKFSRFSFNMTRHKFSDTIFDACRVEIMKFVRQFPNFDIDTKHLEPRLKKLIVLT